MQVQPGHQSNHCKVTFLRHCNHPDPPTKHAFFIEGGGTKGVYAIGILKYLSDMNPYIKLDGIDLFGGTSIGSYIAAGLSLGCRKDDFDQIAKKIDIADLTDKGYMFAWTMYRFATYGYLYNDGGRRKVISTILNQRNAQIKKHLELPDSTKFDAMDLKIGELRKLIIKYPETYRHLIINTVDLNRNQQLFITTLEDKWDTIKLSDGLLASSALPFVFQPMQFYYDSATDTYSYIPSATSTLNQLIDGGAATNNPLDYFLIHDNHHTYNLWLLVFSSAPTYVPLPTTYSVLTRFISFLISGKNDVKTTFIHSHYKINTINLHSNANTLDYYTPAQIQQIIEDIYNQCVSGQIHFESDTGTDKKKIDIVIV